MADEKVMAEGLRKFAPHQNAPDFVKGTLVISPRKLFDWIKANPDFLTDYQGEKQIKLQELESKSGNPYFVVDTWKKGDAPSTPKQAPKPTESGTWTAPKNNNDDLPF